MLGRACCIQHSGHQRWQNQAPPEPGHDLRRDQQPEPIDPGQDDDPQAL